MSQTINQINLTNFKQFRRASLQPKPGMNLIVGRNGEGKSNLLQALKIGLNQTVEDDNCITTAENVAHTEIQIILQDQDVKKVFTNQASTFTINNKQIPKDKVEQMLNTQLLIINQSETTYLSTLQPDQLFKYFQNSITMQNYDEKKKSITQQLDQAQSKRQQSEDLIQEFELNLTEIRAQMEEYNQYQQVKQQIQKIEHQLNELQVQQLNQEVDSLCHQKQVKQQELSLIDNKHKHIEAEITEKEDHIDQIILQTSQMQLEIENIKKYYQSLLQINQFETDNKTQSKDNITTEKELNSDLQSKLQELENINKQIEQLNLHVYKHKINTQQLQQPQQKIDKEQISKQILQYQDELLVTEQSIKEIEQQQLKQTKQQNVLIQNDFATKQNTVNQLYLKLERSQRRKQQQRINVNKALGDVFSCYNKQNSSILDVVISMNEQKPIPGYLGLFGQLITINQDAYIVLEQAGGFLMNQIVMDTNDNALQLINTLQTLGKSKPELQGCRVNILVVEDFKQNQEHLVSFASQIQSQETAVSLADVIVPLNDAIKPIINNYFARVLIVLTFAIANQFSQQYNCDCYTSEGDCVLKSGLINAGFHTSARVQAFQKLVIEYQKNDEIQNELQQLVAQLEGENQGLQKLSNDQLGQQQLISQIQTNNNKLTTLNTQKQEIQQEIQKQNIILDSVNQKTDTDQQKIDINQIQINLQQLINVQQTLKNDIQDTQFKCQEFEKYKEILQQIHSLKFFNSDQNLQNSSKDQLMVIIKQHISQVEEQLSTHQQEIENHNQTKLLLNNELQQIKLQHEQLQESVSQFADTIFNIQNNILMLQRKQIILIQNSQQSNSQDEIANNSTNKQYLQQLLQTYNAKLKQFNSQNNLIFETYEIKEQQLNQLKQDLEKLKNAEQEINNLILQLEDKHVNELQNNFAIINEQFKQIFKYLTNKDGQLKLQKEQLLIQTDFNKKSSFNELSGGQLAITSLAFILSMNLSDNYNIYLLDEVDSNLDQTARLKLAELLHQKIQQEKVQIFVTSFKKELVEKADVIFQVKNGEVFEIMAADEVSDGVWE